jgi:hypothetical protein
MVMEKWMKWSKGAFIFGLCIRANIFGAKILLYRPTHALVFSPNLPNTITLLSRITCLVSSVLYINYSLTSRKSMIHLGGSTVQYSHGGGVPMKQVRLFQMSFQETIVKFI